MCLLQFHILQTQSYTSNILDIIDCLGHTDIHEVFRSFALMMLTDFHQFSIFGDWTRATLNITVVPGDRTWQKQTKVHAPIKGQCHLRGAALRREPLEDVRARSSGNLTDRLIGVSCAIIASGQRSEHRSWRISIVESYYQATTRERYKWLRLSMCCSNF
jgi:hypothetical protein